MRAMVISDFNNPWELRELADPRPAPGQVLIRTNRTLISTGTELIALHRRFDRADTGLDMRFLRQLSSR